MNSPRILALFGGTYIGGVEIVTLRVFQGLQERGYDLFCLTNGWNNGEFHKRLHTVGIRFQAVKLGWFYLRNPWWTLDSLLHLPRALWKSSVLLRQTPHELVYVGSYRQIVLLYPWLRKPVVFHVHDPLSQDRQFRKLLPWIERKITHYIAVSEYIQNDLIRCGIDPAKISKVYNGVDVPSQILSSRQRPLPSALNLGIVGQVIPRKGHTIAVEALALLKEQGVTNLNLLIVGKGDPAFEKALREQIRTAGLVDRVEWRGFKNTLAEIYADIDILLAPSITPEPFGMIAIEAQAFGIPVIVSDQGGLPETVSHSETGFVIPAGNPTELAMGIARVSQDFEILSKLAEEGKLRVSTYFSTQNMLERIDSIFQSVFSKFEN